MQRTPSIESGARSGPGRKGNVVSTGKRSGRVRRMFKFSPVGRSVGPGWHLVRAAESASNCFLGTISEQKSHSGTAICGNRPTGRAVYARPSLADGKTRRTAPGFSRRLQQARRGLLLSFSLSLSRSAPSRSFFLFLFCPPASSCILYLFLSCSLQLFPDFSALLNVASCNLFFVD